MDYHKYIVWALLTIVIGLILAFSKTLIELNRQQKFFLQNQAILSDKLTQALNELNANRYYIQQFQNNQDYRDWVVRRHLGYVNENEFIFNFQNPTQKQR